MNQGQYLWGWSLLVLLFLPIGSPGATISVCDEASLRSAVSAGGNIVFECDGIISLSQTLVVSNDVSLDANGHAVTISGNNQVRVFWVNPVRSLTLRGLTIADGLYAGTNGVTTATNGESASGGGIFNAGALVFMDCTFSNNVAKGGDGILSDQIPGDGGFARGGAICSLGGVVRGTNSLFISNACLGGAGSPSGSRQADGADAFGGAMFFSGASYIFEGLRFMGNRAVGARTSPEQTQAGGRAGHGSGGAIHAALATGTVVRATFSANQALGGNATFHGPPGIAQGGGITISNGTLQISNTTLSANLARGGSGYFLGPSGPGFGGALMNAGNISISTSYFVDNLATGGPPGFSEAGTPVIYACAGGAIENRATGIVEGCTFATNTVRGSNGGDGCCTGGPTSGGQSSGGAINIGSGSLQIRNSSFAHNLAQGGNGAGARPGGPAFGGAVANYASLILTHSTIATNSALYGRQGQSSVVSNGFGGGIHSGASTTLGNSLLSGNLAGTNAAGSLIDHGNNISSDGSGAFTMPGSRNNVDPLLSPLDDYGGPTLTMALTDGSPAIDGALATHCVATDQRGAPRPYGAQCDIGAFEWTPLYSISGSIVGYLPPEGITVTAGMRWATTDQSGAYSISGLWPGTHDVVPSAPNILAVPHERTIELTANTSGVDFRSYRWNALVIESHTQDILQITYAGTPGQMHEVQKTSTFEQWSPVLTNTTDSNGLFTFPYSATASREFFRTRRLE